ncbi:hypothetical protein GH714_035115 [Hevea brasiliensis]|uniref:Uncharacterized protein n=1 Tax=Hevea brasiliensis TaxID=3981 RepID=A0A6A6KMV4_HEVBR|nr:hypothetical protein GH714_035115 [Hevea brasiliensis]
MGLLLASLDTIGADIGVCYGMLGNDLPPPGQVIVGNEIMPSDRFAQFPVPAMINIRNELFCWSWEY